MSESPSSALLRLRESDVVRLCGLAATARGLELVSRRAVVRARREGARLSAQVQSLADAATTACVVIAGESLSGSPPWSCTCPAGQAHAAGAKQGVRAAADHAEAGADELACEHVAAVLSTWIRHPGEFAPAGAALGLADRQRSTEGAGGGALQRRSERAVAEPGASAATSSVRQFSLLEELERLAEPERAAIARRVLGATAEPTATAEMLAERLAAALADPRLVAGLLARLDPSTAWLLRAVALLGGTVTLAELDSMAERAALSRLEVEGEIGALARHGLLFRTPGTARVAGGEQGRAWRQLAGWRLPAEVAGALGRGLPLEPLRAVGDRGPPLLAATTERPAAPRPAQIQPGMARQLCGAVALLVHAPGPVGLSGAAPRRGTGAGRERDGLVRLGAPVGRGRALPPVPGDPPAAALTAWARGAQVPPGLARMARRALLRALEAEGSGTPFATLDRLPAAEWPLALRVGFRFWLAADSHAELVDLMTERDGVHARCDPGHPALRPAALAAENATARRFVAGLLAQAPAGAWLALDAVRDLVWRLDPYFLRGRQRAFDSPGWWLEDGASGRRLRADVAHEWWRGDGRYLRALLVGPLHWWGAVDLALTPRGVPWALRLTPLGAFLLGTADAPPDAVRTLKRGWGPAVLPTREAALALQPLTAGPTLLDALRPWVHITAVAGGRLIARPSPDLACRNLDAGREPAAALACLRSLDERDGTHAHATLERVLGDWRARYGTTRIAEGLALLEAGDEATLREALAVAPALGERCQVVAPNLALVPQAALDALRAALNQRGFVA
jgi:hypothetical protein